MPELNDIPKKRGWRVAVALITFMVVLVAVLVVGFEGWRQNALAVEIANLRSAAARMESDILKGRSPQRFYEERAGGRNGWQDQEVAFGLMGDLRGMTPEQLAEAGPDARDPRSLCELLIDEASESAPPTPAEMRHLIARSKSLQDAVAAASRAEVIAWKPEAGENMWNGLMVGVLERQAMMQMLAARIAAHKRLGDFGAASQEALVAVRFAELHTRPCNLVACLVDVGGRNIAWQAAGDLALDNKLPDDILRANWPAVASCDALFDSALEAECVSTWVFLEADSMARPEGWFDWRAGSKSNPLMDGGPNTPLTSLALRRETARGINHNLQQLSEFRSSADKANRGAYTPPAPDSLLEFNAAGQYARMRNEFIKLHQWEAAVALRLAELDGALKPEVIKGLAEKYVDIDITIDGDIVIRPRKAFFDRLRLEASDAPAALRLPAKK
ncbi:MAG: hypothetical protein IT462_15500 [Planctomycetes bacterium]|nr:hypothetical protein [Planctomycetota bacterium]